MGMHGGKGKHDRRMGMHGRMGGKGKHDRRMGRHGEAWGGKGKHYRRMGMHGEALGSEDVELAAVLIVGAEGLECFGSHTEDEVVGEDRVVVLEDGGDLSLGLAFQVKAD